MADDSDVFAIDVGAEAFVRCATDEDAVAGDEFQAGGGVHIDCVGAILNKEIFVVGTEVSYGRLKRDGQVLASLGVGKS